MITKIKNCRIVTADEILSGKSLYFENGTVTAITDENLPFDECIDAEGNYLSAGLIDLHVHGAANGDFADGDAQAVLDAANHHCKHGTTTIFPTTLSASYESIDRALTAIREALASGNFLPSFGGVHLEGPYFSQKQCGAQNPVYITPPVKSDYERLLKQYGDLIARWSFAPELPGSDEFQKALLAAGVIPSIGHSDAVYEDVMAAYEGGCRLITHFYSCISTITRKKGFRQLGIMECGYLLDDITVEAIGDGCHVPKELFSLLYKIKGRDRICLITDSMRCCGVDIEFAEIGGIPCKIKNGVACLLDESAFAGSIATADRLIRFAAREVGIPLTDSIRMMTVNPARVMGLAKKGSLCPGYDADLILFDEDINIQKVIVAGKPVA